MGKLYCLLGKSGSGKDTIFKLLMNDESLRLSPVVTYTTRPRREHETDGVEYNFITPEVLMSLKSEGKIIEMRKYNTVKGVWYYCTVDDGKVNLENGDYLTIETLEGYKALRNYYGSSVVPLYLEVEDSERLIRSILREREQRSPDYNELCRRFLADSEDFSEQKLIESGIIYRFQNTDAEKCAGDIKKFILEKGNERSVC